jgi:hypothetical protein
MGFIVNKKIKEYTYGELDSFYVRIDGYTVNKIESTLTLTVNLYLNKDVIDKILTQRITTINGVIGGNIFFDNRLLNVNELCLLHIPIIKRETKIIDEYELMDVPSIITYYDFNDDGELIEVEESIVSKEDVKVGEYIDVIRTNNIASILNDKFFNTCYTIVKDRFGTVFGLDNIIDLI